MTSEQLIEIQRRAMSAATLLRASGGAGSTERAQECELLAVFAQIAMNLDAIESRLSAISDGLAFAGKGR